jgi:hypothetical protein
MLLLLLAAQAAEPVEPVGDLKEVVVNAIRNCPKAAPGEIVVCSRDRGFSEGQRVRPLKAPVNPVAPSVQVSVAASDGTVPGTCANVGAAATTGCSVRDYRRWRAEREREKANPR